MYISAATIDDLLRRVTNILLKSKNRIYPTKGPATEIGGALLQLKNPRARLSRTETRGKPFSCLGELLWYLAKTNELSFIAYYLPDYKRFSDDGETVYGAYGPRMFDMEGNNQVANVIQILRKRPYSRQAVIQLFKASDIAEKHKDIPCTCTLQFMIRDHRLHMLSYMRSNDAFIGLPHDIFAFTMLQEIIAQTLSVNLGAYKHAVGSLHLYDSDREKAQQYVEEGWQSTVSMPAMPAGDPWPSISLVQMAEEEIRRGGEIDTTNLELDPYWKDLVRMLQILSYRKKRNKKAIAYLRKKMSSPIYDVYIRERRV